MAEGLRARLPRAADLSLAVRTDGSARADAPALLLIHELGLDLTMWDGVVAALPPGLRIVRYDMRGHGATPTADLPWTMGRLIADAAAVCDFLGLRDAVVAGLGVGALIAQGLAVKRFDAVRGLVIAHGAARLGTPGRWQDRAAAVRAGGMAAVADATVARWFSRDATAAGLRAVWRDRLLATDAEGHAATCAAIAGADFRATTEGLRLPTLAIAGTEDADTPADLVRDTADLIPGARFALMRRTGHLSCVEAPAGHAALLTGFLEEIGHLGQGSAASATRW